MQLGKFGEFVELGLTVTGMQENQAGHLGR
jgi:hypothetical protein